jgi:hypothetical protein
MSHHTEAHSTTTTAGAAPARRHRPPPAVAVTLVVAVQALFVFCLGYPALHASPHGVPIGVAGPPADRGQLGSALARQKGAFDVHAYARAAAARAAVRGRDVYGALVAAPGGLELLVASAASPAITAMLASEADALGHGRTVTVTDLVPAPGKDPEETGALTTLLPLVLLSLALGAVLAFAERRARRVFGWCAFASMAAGLAVSGVASGLGTFAGSYWADAGVLALLVFGLSAVTAGLVAARPLRPFGSLFVLTMIFLGIPSAGALVPPELLAQPWRATGPGLPPAAAVDAMRGITFFDGAAVSRPLTVLACWAVLGALLVFLAPAAAKTLFKSPGRPRGASHGRRRRGRAKEDRAGPRPRRDKRVRLPAGGLSRRLPPEAGPTPQDAN